MGVMCFICIIPGDGCGKEVTNESIGIIDALREQLDIEYEVCEAGAEYYLKTGRAWESETIERAEEADAILFGAVGRDDVRKPDGTTPAGEVIFGLRNGLDLYANVRPIRLYPGILQRLSGRLGRFWRVEDVDIVIVRENTEGLYVRIGGISNIGGVALDNRIITKKGSSRITEFAAEIALKRRAHLTCVDKSNVLMGDRYFRENFRRITRLKKYERIYTDFYYVDAFAMRLLTDPANFDVVVMPNLYGDIITDIGAVLQGGLGIAPSGNYGEKNAMFEPVHGSAPDIAGKGIVNPSASLLSLSMLLEYLSRKVKEDTKDFLRASEAIEDAVVKTITAGIKTPDLGGNATTWDVGRCVRKEVISLLKS